MLLQELPAELLGRSFGNLSLRERCSTIPFLSHTFLRIHKDFPPTCKDLDCGPLKPWHAGLLNTITDSLESLGMEAPEAAVLTEVMVVPLSRLRRLQISFESSTFGHGLPVNLSGLSGLCQITKLTIRNWSLDEVAGLESFIGLRSLKKVHLFNLHYACKVSGSAAAGELGDLFWSTMAAIPSIEKADVILSGTSKPYYARELIAEDDSLCAFLRSVPLANQLRSLRIGTTGSHFFEMLQKQGELYKHLQKLTLLTALKLHAFSFEWRVTACQEIATLKKLSLCALPWKPAQHLYIGASLGGTSLTCLKLYGGTFGNRTPAGYSLTGIIPADTAVLPHLRELHIVDMHLAHFPAEVASALVRLTALHLSPGNRLARIPAAVSVIATLEILDLSGSLPLKDLDEDDVRALDAIAALPCLKYLNIMQSSTRWHDAVAPRILSIQEIYVKLEVLY